MTYCFFDTSALVKRYYPESGTETVDELVEDPDRVVIITTLSVVETASAFRRKYNRDEIESDRIGCTGSWRPSSRRRWRTSC